MEIYWIFNVPRAILKGFRARLKKICGWDGRKALKGTSIHQRNERGQVTYTVGNNWALQYKYLFHSDSLSQSFILVTLSK
jgi:hypothetical protein